MLTLLDSVKAPNSGILVRLVNGALGLNCPPVSDPRLRPPSRAKPKLRRPWMACQASPTPCEYVTQHSSNHALRYVAGLRWLSSILMTDTVRCRPRFVLQVFFPQRRCGSPVRHLASVSNLGLGRVAGHVTGRITVAMLVRYCLTYSCVRRLTSIM
jgi:hypothetical protein